MSLAADPAPRQPRRRECGGASNAEVCVKKMAIGCMTVMVVLVVSAGIASFVAYRMISSTVSEFAELGRVPDLERSVRNQSAFAAPAAGELSPSQVARFVSVQQAVRARLGARFAEFEIRYR